MLLDRELSVAKTLALQAGEKISQHGPPQHVWEKPNQEGLVTEMDLAIDRFIIQGLSKAFPSDTIITEETYSSPTRIPKTGRVWFVDPIDGTSDYVEGGCDYCTMIGLSVDGIPRLGVVFQNSTSTLWWGIWDPNNPSASMAKQRRSDGQEQPLCLMPKEPKGCRVVASKHHHSPLICHIIRCLQPDTVVVKGSVGLKILSVAEAQADLYFLNPKTKLWDTCAPHAILAAANGQLQTFHFESIAYFNPIVHNQPLACFHPSYLSFLKDNLLPAMIQWNKENGCFSKALK